MIEFSNLFDFKYTIDEVDIPYQVFSISCKQNGFKDTRGTLFFDVIRIASYHKPKILFVYR